MTREESPPAVTTPRKTLSEKRGSVVISLGLGITELARPSVIVTGWILLVGGLLGVEFELTESERGVKYPAHIRLSIWLTRIRRLYGSIAR